jgi:REP element-mobilizing transposase RayT
MAPPQIASHAARIAAPLRGAGKAVTAEEESMPCYLFTFHAHGTWLPDKGQGYVHRTKGIKPKDESMADRYRANQKHPTIYFTSEQQDAIAASLRDAGPCIETTIHAIATEPTHFHVLVSWQHERQRESIRRCLRTAVSVKLNRAFGKRVWLVKNSSRKQVKDEEHFVFLIGEYLSSHRGVFYLRGEDRKRLPDPGTGTA